ncbi:hypothetical protein MalM25_19820 [Planctomycetes bacterium MalM25]|nr:hypothetical protein MalM25_19820 [Planctomycetes bacterium MalM25]
MSIVDSKMSTLLVGGQEIDYSDWNVPEFRQALRTLGHCASEGGKGDAATLLMQMVRTPAPELVHINTDDAGRPYLRLRSEYSGAIESIDLLIASERHRHDHEFTWETLHDLAAEDSPPSTEEPPYCINPDHGKTERRALLFDPRMWTAVAELKYSSQKWK